MIIAVDNATGTIIRYGPGVNGDDATTLYTVPDSALSVFSQPGTKTYDVASNTIIVGPPPQRQPRPDFTALRNKVVTTAQSAVGVTLDNLTQAQRLSLLACLLYSVGALDPATLAIRPLGQWINDPNTPQI